MISSVKVYALNILTPDNSYPKFVIRNTVAIAGTSEAKLLGQSNEQLNAVEAIWFHQSRRSQCVQWNPKQVDPRVFLSARISTNACKGQSVPKLLQLQHMCKCMYKQELSGAIATFEIRERVVQHVAISVCRVHVHIPFDLSHVRQLSRYGTKGQPWSRVFSRTVYSETFVTDVYEPGCFDDMDRSRNCISVTSPTRGRSVCGCRFWRASAEDSSCSDNVHSK